MPNTPADAPQIPSGPNVGFMRFEIANLIRVYEKIRDVLAGEEKIKEKEDRYLPRPNAADKSEENKERYLAYICRAVFYNFTKRTLAGLVGQIFLRDPEITVPDLMQILKTDFSGSGTSMSQFASAICKMVLSYGRMGLLIDYPNADTPATVAQIQAGKVRPAVLRFSPWNVINWRTIVRNGKLMLSLVVIYESIVEEDDGFQQTMVDQWRVLTLEPTTNADGTITYGNYKVQLYQKADNGYKATSETYFPKDANGNFLDEIPFVFVGVEDNDPSVDEPPLYDLASLNVAHYRNSADYEEACFFVGQPTPVVTGLTESWVKEILHDSITFGSRKAVPLPVGGDMKLVQAQPNSMPKEAMDMKEREAVALGAKLVEQKSVQRTLGEAELENAAENSVLANVGKNAEAAMLFALNWCARFMIRTVVPTGEISFGLNTEFDLTQMDQAERAETIREWQQGAITEGEMRSNLRRGGIAMLDDKTFQTERAKDDARRLQVAKDMAAASAPVNNPNVPVSRNPNSA